VDGSPVGSVSQGMRGFNAFPDRAGEGRFLGLIGQVAAGAVTLPPVPAVLNIIDGRDSAGLLLNVPTGALNHMSSPILLSIVESPAHPAFSALYRRLGLQEVRATSQRKAIAQLKKTPPDWVVAEFFYGYGNNYAGANLSNLDVFLSSLQRYASGCRVIVLVDKAERAYVDRLGERFPLHSVLVQPAGEQAMQAALGHG
jgi:hypothetical protein